MERAATASGPGLDRIGRVVNVSRTLQLPAGTNPFLGFEEAGDPLFLPFGQGTFFTGGSLTSNFQLVDADYRTLIYAKMAANICDGSIPAINQVLLTLFPNRGNCYVADGENMTMEYVFAFNLSAVELAIVEQSGALPKPVGVSVNRRAARCEMQSTGIPGKLVIPFASAAAAPYIRAIPQSSQIGIQNGAASFTDGFPPLCFQPETSGGVPPFGEDFNGILNVITLWTRWQSAGAPAFYHRSLLCGGRRLPEVGAAVAGRQPRLRLRSRSSRTTCRTPTPGAPTGPARGTRPSAAC